ncbi:unnamed protein product [Darwinula stevensoni]|uniref:Uncharacterized protein n=1 Tax=Darwinula stevensoni TaxID=69355 RepID=A0A7R9FP15_9CRUS|nr:unnamed protein product [Darwinula stevensoni]CAG0897338.1 unnamed protein product [Darwinula stevensoni]
MRSRIAVQILAVMFALALTMDAVVGVNYKTCKKYCDGGMGGASVLCTFFTSGWLGDQCQKIINAPPKTCKNFCKLLVLFKEFDADSEHVANFEG